MTAFLNFVPGLMLGIVLIALGIQGWCLWRLRPYAPTPLPAWRLWLAPLTIEPDRVLADGRRWLGGALGAHLAAFGALMGAVGALLSH